MRIFSIQDDPITRLPFLNAGRRALQFTEETYPVQLGYVDQLPGGVDAIIVMADLQGRERFQDADPDVAPRLMGEVIPDRLLPTLDELQLYRNENIGVILAGDFYTLPDLSKRGGTGCVADVWRCLASCFRWVVGVPGNHDLFDGSTRFQPEGTGKYFLDGDSVELDGIHFAGLGGIIGNPRRVQRRKADQYEAELATLLGCKPDVVILHDGPEAFDGRTWLPGNSSITEWLEVSPPPLVIRGHSHWRTPLAELPSGTQVLNVDSRIVILRSAEQT